MNEQIGIQVNQDYSRFLVPFSAVAFIVGSFVRFWQLGGAPLAVDEYYFGSSMLNIVERGLPAFPCGGYYTRGVLIQYLSIPFVHFGATLEFAARFWPAVFSLFTIAAIWRIGNLAGGRAVGLIAVILCSLSVWEVEFARFGRMYSPFQAIFVWYVYFQIVHLVKARNSAKWFYLGLSGVAIFVYAGAIFLLALNFLALIWPGKRWTYTHLFIASGLLFAGIVDQSVDYRYLGVSDGQSHSAVEYSAGVSLPLQLPDTPSFVALIATTAALLVVFGAWRYRRAFVAAHPSIMFWSIASLCLCTGLLGFGLALFAAGLIMRLPKPRGIVGNDADKWPVTLFGLALLWSTVFLLSSMVSGDPLSTNLKGAFNYIVNYPDVYHKVLLPWILTIPVTTMLLGFFSAVSVSVILFTTLVQINKGDVLRYLFAISVLLILLVGITEQPYRITRYTYFLYPVILIISSAGIHFLAQIVTRNSWLRFLATMLSIATLASLSEDFRVEHLARINEPQFRYRTTYDRHLSGHYYLRWDYREVSNYVNNHIAASDSVVVFDQPATYYLARTSGIFIRQGTSIHTLTSACGGERHLWSNKPLLDQDTDLQFLIDNTDGSTWFVMRTEIARTRDPLEASLVETYSLRPVFQSQDGNLAVYRLPAPGNQEQ